jgi:putative NADH-flavin reductase
MKIAIIGASGKTGTKVVREALRRGHAVVGVCREGSEPALDEFAASEAFTLATAPVVSDRAVLTRALAGCHAVVAVPISVKKLKATDLMASLAAATGTHGITRLVFTAGEITVRPAPDERFTLRQKLMSTLLPPLLALTPYSLYDMVAASDRAMAQEGWDWTFVRASTLHERPAEGYRLIALADVTGKFGLGREDYAAALLDSVDNPAHIRRRVTVTSAKDV